MNGKIYFKDLAEVAYFCKQFVGSTATFEIAYCPKAARWVLEFLEGF